RREDMGLLIAALVRRLAPAPDAVSFRPETIRLLLSHGWPGNVRELEKRLGAALVLAGEDNVGAAHFDDLATAPADKGRARALPSEASLEQRAKLERLLADHQGNLAAVARALGKDRVQIRRWLRRYGIDAAAFR